MQFLYKLVNSKIDSPYLLGKLNFHVPRSNLRMSNLFVVPYCNTVRHYNFSFIKMLRNYNSKHMYLDLFADTYTMFTKSCYNLFS